MVVRVRDLERRGKFNKLVSFIDPAAKETEVSLPYGKGGVALGYFDAVSGKVKVITRLEDVSKASRLIDPGTEFFQSLEEGDKVRLTFGGGQTVQLDMADSVRLSAETSAVGLMLEGEPVTIENLSGGSDLTVWCRIDDAALSDSPAYARVSSDLVAEVGSNTRRVLFIRTRANPAITVDHKARFDGREYQVKAIQQLERLSELRLSLVLVSPD